MKKIYNWFRNVLIRLWGVIKYMMKENTIAKVEAIDATKEVILAAGKGSKNLITSIGKEIKNDVTSVLTYLDRTHNGKSVCLAVGVAFIIYALHSSYYIPENQIPYESFMRKKLNKSN